MFTSHNLTVRYGSRRALDDLTMDFESTGRICGLFGPNGAGKATLMNTIIGDINHFSGQIDRPPRDHIAYLPDKPFLYPWLTIRQCFDLFQSRYPDFRRYVAEDIVEGFGLTANGRVKECSKGMSERLHLALVIARSSRYYVLDEPLAAVDPLTRDFLIDMIETKRRQDSTVLISTHLINDVESLFSDVAMISDGHLLYYGAADALRESEGTDLESAFKQKVAAYV